MPARPAAAVALAGARGAWTGARDAVRAARAARRAGTDRTTRAGRALWTAGLATVTATTAAVRASRGVEGTWRQTWRQRVAAAWQQARQAAAAVRTARHPHADQHDEHDEQVPAEQVPAGQEAPQEQVQCSECGVQVHVASPMPKELLNQQLLAEGARVTAMERRLLLQDIPPEERDALEDEFEAALAAYQQLSDQWVAVIAGLCARCADLRPDAVRSVTPGVAAAQQDVPADQAGDSTTSTTSTTSTDGNATRATGAGETTTGKEMAMGALGMTGELETTEEMRAEVIAAQQLLDEAADAVAQLVAWASTLPDRMDAAPWETTAVLARVTEIAETLGTMQALDDVEESLTAMNPALDEADALGEHAAGIGAGGNVTAFAPA